MAVYRLPNALTNANKYDNIENGWGSSYIGNSVASTIGSSPPGIEVNIWRKKTCV